VLHHYSVVDATNLAAFLGLLDDANGGCPESPPKLRCKRWMSRISAAESPPKRTRGLGFHYSYRRTAFRSETGSRAALGARDFKDTEGIDEGEIVAGLDITVGGLQVKAVTGETGDR